MEDSGLVLATEDRERAIAFFQDRGCTLTPDVEHIPPQLTERALEAQREIVNNKIAILNIYSLRIPSEARIRGEDLANLGPISELKLLAIADGSITPKDMKYLGLLSRLEIAIFRGTSFGDAHSAALPHLPSMRMIDVQDTSVTQPGVATLQIRFPDARIYSDHEEGA